jgi:peptidoglycan/LPS O-acetylase OafA/YrhL
VASGRSHRPDIDGLRALAILPVLPFDAGLAGFSGGHVGVDIYS